MAIAHDLIDPDAQKVIHRLVRHGYQAYLVGGCVRDLLLGRTPKDFDIATSATPQQIKDCFRNCRIIGRRFRLAHIFFGSKIIETATFRSNPREAEAEATEGDGAAGPPDQDLLIRRDNVFGTADEDARRRDFTINGLFFDLERDQVIDYVGGLADLATRTVRTIGDADIRFREDPVRILRAIKFAARLDFTIEESAWRAILTHKVEIPKCAPPRVLEELYRLMRGGAARRSMELLRETGVLQVLIPELDALLGPDGGEGARALWQVLARLDERMRTGGAAPTNAVLLGILVGPFVGPELFEDPDGRVPDIGQLVDDRTRVILERMRASRRDCERARQILLAERRIVPGKRKRGRPQALARRDWFGEALQVYDLLAPVLAPQVWSEEDLARWQRLAHEAVQSQPAQEGGRPGEAFEERRGRRRRRGGRRRRRAISGEAPPDSAPPTGLAAKPE